MSIEYFITVLVICLSPGIGVGYTLSATLGGGWKAGFWASLGFPGLKLAIEKA